MHNYLNSIPDTTMRELFENVININNIKSSEMKNYLFNIINSTPNNNLRETIENNANINNVKGNEIKNYLFNYIDSISDNNFRTLTENNIMLTSLKPMQIKSYLINKFGDDIIISPSVSLSTIFLWILPLIFAALGVMMILKFRRLSSTRY
jgi:hypothetical protein